MGLGWGVTNSEGAEIWDSEPVFRGESVGTKDWLKLLFYPKKFVLYHYIRKHINEKLKWKGQQEIIRILDIGCGTGSDVIDFKKMFGRRVEVVGIDVVALQIDLAKEKIKKNGVWADVMWYDGEHFPFENDYFDAIYSSDVLGHVKSVPAWLQEIYRVLKDDGVLAMFAESKLGRHAYVRNYLYNRGLNIDPHAEYHISLFPKVALKEFLEAVGFEIKKIYGLFWASFFVHPDEFYEKLQSQKKFPILRWFNKILYKVKKKFHPYSTAWSELYGLVEMYLVGKWVEAQGYVILAKKK